MIYAPEPQIAPEWGVVGRRIFLTAFAIGSITSVAPIPIYKARGQAWLRLRRLGLGGCLQDRHFGLKPGRKPVPVSLSNRGF